MENLALVTWLIPAPLFIAFGLMSLMAFGKFLTKPLATAIAMAAVLLSLVLAMLVFVSAARVNLHDHPIASAFPSMSVLLCA